MKKLNKEIPRWMKAIFLNKNIDKYSVKKKGLNKQIRHEKNETEAKTVAYLIFYLTKSRLKRYRCVLTEKKKM